jgi:hypothetical protein
MTAFLGSEVQEYTIEDHNYDHYKRQLSWSFEYIMTREEFERRLEEDIEFRKQWVIDYSEENKS